MPLFTENHQRFHSDMTLTHRVTATLMERSVELKRGPDNMEARRPLHFPQSATTVHFWETLVTVH